MSVKKQSGYVTIIAIILALLALGAGVGYFYFHIGQKAKPADKKPVASTAESTPAKTTVVDPYAGWKTYTSTYAKVSFKYPSDWKLSKYAAFDAQEIQPTADAIQLTSPGGLTVSWVAYLGGLGGACDDKLPVGTDFACALYKIVEVKALPSVIANYSAGVMTNDGTTFTPWMAIQSKDGVLTDRQTLGILAWQAAGTKTQFFGTGSAVSGLVTSAKGTEAAAKAFFATDEAKQAALILQSATY